jgi:hypothetical protein
MVAMRMAEAEGVGCEPQPEAGREPPFLAARHPPKWRGGEWRRGGMGKAFRWRGGERAHMGGLSSVNRGVLNLGKFRSIQNTT